MPGKLVEAVVRSQVGRQTDEIHAVAFSPDGSKVLTGGHRDDLFPVVDLMSLDGSGRPPRIITDSPNPVLKLWDALTGQLVQSFTDHPTPILVAAFSRDASRVVSGGAAHYRAGDKELYANRERRAITSGQKLAMVRSVGNLVKVWDVSSGKERHAFQWPGGTISAVAFGRVVATLDTHDVFRLWNPETGQPDGRTLSQLEDDSKQSYPGATISADGLKAMAVRGGHPKLFLKQWDVSKGCARKWEIPKGSADSIALAPEGKLFATCALKEKIRLWDFESRELVREFNGLDDDVPIGLLGFSPDGSLLATGGRNDTVQVWDVATGRPIASARGTERHSHASSSGHVRAVAFLPDGVVRVAAGGWEYLLLEAKEGEIAQIKTDPETGIPMREPLLVWDFKI